MSFNSVGNIYTAKKYHEDNFLPRGPIGEEPASIPKKMFSAEEKITYVGPEKTIEVSFPIVPPSPIQFSRGSAIGDLQNG
ncbi:MAG TPA: hypothetical protein DCM40_11790, partial [Maribacter sp.]|nr:hypothetical protein [Maribacter sp.]